MVAVNWWDDPCRGSIKAIGKGRICKCRVFGRNRFSHVTVYCRSIVQGKKIGLNLNEIRLPEMSKAKVLTYGIISRMTIIKIVLNNKSSLPAAYEKVCMLHSVKP